MIVDDFCFKKTQHSEVAFWLPLSSDFSFVVRFFICVGIMAAAYYNQNTLFYNQINSGSFALLISAPRERRVWAQCYSHDEKASSYSNLMVPAVWG